MPDARVAVVLAAAGLAAAGCRTPEPGEIAAIALEVGARPAEPEGLPGGDPGTGDSPPAAGEKGVRFLAGARAFDGRLNGRAAGAPSHHGMDASGIPGFSAEFRFLSLEDSDTWNTAGILLEHFRNAEDKEVPGGKARTEGALTGVFLAAGWAGSPVRDGAGLPTDFGWRLEGLIGVRRGFVLAEVPTGPGGTYRRSSTWGEFAVGLRGEVSPVRRVFLFLRGDMGAETAGRAFSDEEEAREDTAIGARSWQFTAGIRVRPAPHVSLLAGWRYLRLDGNEIVDEGRDEIDKAAASWTGPWAGLEVDF